MQTRRQFLQRSLGLFLLFLLGMAFIQFVTPDMPDNDGFYHIKLAWLMRTEQLCCMSSGKSRIPVRTVTDDGIQNGQEFTHT
ncbi:hypothetical protein FBQ81_09820, partial [Chloroflexi bacterium CFX6]|nr:hypothetical protein [Chloroflexi bacterium CFX6]